MTARCPKCEGTVTGRRGHDPLIDYFWLGCPGVPDKRGRGMTHIHRIVATPGADSWDIWRYVPHGVDTPAVSPDRIIATCDRWDDAVEIAESMNVRKDAFA